MFVIILQYSLLYTRDEGVVELEIIDISDNETRLNRERERRAVTPKDSSIIRRIKEVMVSAKPMIV